MNQTALDTFSITRQAVDPRADGGQRVVHVSAKQIVIERVIQNVRMKVAVPVAAYRGLVLSVRVASATASLRLRHEDQDLDVALGSGDAIEMARKAKAWSVVFGKEIAIEEASIAIREPFLRQRHRVKPSRRSGFAKRRKSGVTARLETTYAGEREIIARD